MGLAVSGAVGAVSLAIVLLLMPTGCNWPGSPSKSSADKTAIEPDSVKGDTTFYHYAVKYVDGAKEEVFATFDGSWHMFRLETRILPPWIAPNNWTGVGTTLHLICVSNDSAVIAAADSVIAANGHRIEFRVVQGHPWYTGLPMYYVRIAEQSGNPLLLSAPLLEYLTLYGQYPAVFKAVYPSVQVSLL
jgi:hypothetical protein